MTDLSFEIVSRYRPFELVSSAFTAVDEPARHVDALQVHAQGPPAPFCAVEADVVGAATRIGLADGAGRHLVAFADRSRGLVGLELRTERGVTVLGQQEADLTDRFRLAFVLCENKATVLTDTGDGWHPRVTERDGVSAVLDLRDPATLGRFRYAWGPGEDGAPVRLERLRAGLFGMAGLRDQHLVQHADGTPYVRDGHAYFTATCAGLGFFQQAHWGVFRWDLAGTRPLEQVGQLFSYRDGLLLGDHAGQVVRDDDRGRWIVATSSWGDFSFDGVHVRHVETTDDVLHGVHLLETEPTPLPTDVSAWDPGITRIDGRWHVSFVESPSQQPFDFHPALARSANGSSWLEGLELVGAATDLHQCEGPILARDGDRWWFLASDGDHRVYPVFDLDMKRVGELDAPYETNIPHPQLVPREDGAYWLVTFDGTQFHEDVLGYGTHGDVLVMRSRS